MKFLNDIKNRRSLKETLGFIIDDDDDNIVNNTSNDTHKNSLIDDLENSKDVITLSKTKFSTKTFDPFYKVIEKYFLQYNDMSEMEDYEKKVIEIAKSCDCNLYNNFIPINNIRDLKLLIIRAIPVFGYDGNYNWIDTSNMTSLSALFKGNEKWNGDITKWNVENVQNMNYTFDGCISFKRDLSGWNTRSLKFMTGCFLNSGYDKNIIKKWNMKKVITRYNIF